MANILIVDDDDALREVLVEAVQGFGHEVKSAGDGVEALQIYRQHKIDLVVTDLKMPQMDGLELLKEIRIIRADAIVLMITGYPTIDSAVHAIRLGAYDYVTKPFKVEHIEVVIRRALEKKRLLEQLGLFRGMFWLATFSIPAWIVLGFLWFHYISD